MTATLDRAPRPALPVGRTAGATWFAVAATLLGGLAPLLLMVSTPLTNVSSPAWAGAWAFSVAAGLRYAWLVADGARRLFETVFWLFAYVFLGLAPLVQMRSGSYPGTTPRIDLARNGTTVLLVAVGALAFAVGSVLAGRAARAAPAPAAADISSGRVLRLAVGALLFSAYYLAGVGVATVFGSRSDRSVRESVVWPNSTVSAIVAALSTLPLVAAAAALVVLRRQRVRRGERAPAALLLVVLVALAALVNPVSTPRYVSGTAALSVLVALGAVATVRRLRTFVVLLAVGLVLVFPYTDIARYAGQSGSEKRGGPAQVLSSPDFDAFDQINNALAYVEATSPTPGRQLAGAVLFWVPRTVWSGKPDDTGIVLAKFRDYKVTNLSAPLWAEAYVNGGWGGVVVLLGLLGVALRRLDGRMDAVRPRPRSPSVLQTTLPFYALIMFRGSLLQSMAGFAVLLVCGRYVNAPVRAVRA